MEARLQKLEDSHKEILAELKEISNFFEVKRQMSLPTSKPSGVKSHHKLSKWEDFNYEEHLTMPDQVNNIAHNLVKVNHNQDFLRKMIETGAYQTVRKPEWKPSTSTTTSVGKMPLIPSMTTFPPSSPPKGRGFSPWPRARACEAERLGQRTTKFDESRCKCWNCGDIGHFKNKCPDKTAGKIYFQRPEIEQELQFIEPVLNDRDFSEEDEIYEFEVYSLEEDDDSKSYFEEEDSEEGDGFNFHEQ